MIYRDKQQEWLSEIGTAGYRQNMKATFFIYVRLFVSRFAELLVHASFNLSFENNTNTVFFLSHMLHSLFVM